MQTQTADKHQIGTVDKKLLSHYPVQHNNRIIGRTLSARLWKVYNAVSRQASGSPLAEVDRPLVLTLFMAMGRNQQLQQDLRKSQPERAAPNPR